jgi:UDP-galactopyranose mutase
MANDFDLVVYTGPIDEYFEYDLGRLSYRTVFWERHLSKGSFQGNAVINYTDIRVAHTRINEPLYFEPWRTDMPEQSVYFVEFSKATECGDIPYYPVRLDRDKKLLTLYQSRAESLEKGARPRVLFHGRLGTYQYLDMDMVIEHSATLADQLGTDYL